MSNNWEYYLTSVLIFLAVDGIAALGLNLQFGLGGIFNFGYVVFQAIGAYVAGALSAGTPPPGSQETYLFGAQVPFPVPWILGAMAGAVFAVPVGAACLRRLRGDYQAMVMLVFALLCVTVVTDDQRLFNGAAGIFGIPQPLVNDLPLSPAEYGWAYAGVVVLFLVATYLVVERLSSSPFGRALRAVRENESGAEAAGIPAYAVRLKVFVFGGFLAGLSGALLVTFIGAWSPGSWSYAETFVLLSALVVGGLGNNRGALLGTFLLPVLVVQVVGFIPLSSVDASLLSSLEWVLIAAVTLLFLWLWPRGALPEGGRARWRTRQLSRSRFMGEGVDIGKLLKRKSDPESVPVLSKKR